MNLPAIVTTLPPEQQDAIKALEHISVELIDQQDIEPIALTAPAIVAQRNFKRITEMIATIKTALSGVTFDCSTTEGDTWARGVRHKLVRLRTQSDRLRKKANGPYQDQIDTNNDQQKMIVDTLAPFEAAADAAIKAQEEAVRLRKQQEAEEQRQRAAKITEAIASINAYGANLIGKTSEQLAALGQELRAVELVEEDYGARFSEAVSTKDRVLDMLARAEDVARTSEENARQAEAERKRFEEERQAAAKQRAAEQRARTAIDNMRDLLVGAATADAATLAKRVDGLGLNFRPEDFDPLAEEAARVRDQVLTELRAALAERRAADAAASNARIESERLAREQRARDGIAAMHAAVASAVGSDSASISRTIEEIKGLKVADFEPMAREATEAQEKALRGLQQLHDAAQAAERAESEKRAAAERAEAIDKGINALARIAAGHEERKTNAAGIRSALQVLGDDGWKAGAEYGDRTPEAEAIVREQVALLQSLLERVEAEEQEAARQKEVANGAEKLRQEQEADAAMKRAAMARFDRRLADNAMAMFGLLDEVRADPGFMGLAEGLRRRIDDLTALVADRAES